MPGVVLAQPTAPYPTWVSILSRLNVNVCSPIAFSTTAVRSWSCKHVWMCRGLRSWYFLEVNLKKYSYRCPPRRGGGKHRDAIIPLSLVRGTVSRRGAHFDGTVTPGGRPGHDKGRRRGTGLASGHRDRGPHDCVSSAVAMTPCRTLASSSALVLPYGMPPLTMQSSATITNSSIIGTFRGMAPQVEQEQART